MEIPEKKTSFQVEKGLFIEKKRFKVILVARLWKWKPLTARKILLLDLQHQRFWYIEISIICETMLFRNKSDDNVFIKRFIIIRA